MGISKQDKEKFSSGFLDFAEREIFVFAREHVDDDTARLLLSASRYPDIDMPAAVQQIEGLRTAREKWPSLLDCEEFLYPPRLNREQASSEFTARYKASLLESTSLRVNGLTSDDSMVVDMFAHQVRGPQQTCRPVDRSIIDLTGGMGIDTLAFARVAEHVDYVERDPQLCVLMEHNCRALGLDNVTVHNADSMEWLSNNSELITPNSALYIDPARRSTSGRKVAAFEDCEPIILEHIDLLLSHCGRLVVKASPMIDIDLAVRQLGAVDEVHVVAVGGECKEVLFVCGGTAAAEPHIVCCNLNAQGNQNTMTFTKSEESATVPCYCAAVRSYLYEPNAALMKGGPFNLIGRHYGLEKLARNSHLYTSDERVGEFPGRCFEVMAELQLNRKAVLAAVPGGRAHVVTRNYPVEAVALQRQLGLKEGGDIYVIATTLGSRHCGFLCSRI